MSNFLEIKKSKYFTKAIETSIIVLIDYSCNFCDCGTFERFLINSINTIHEFEQFPSAEHKSTQFFFRFSTNKIIFVSMAIYSATCIVIVRVLKIRLNLVRLDFGVISHMVPLSDGLKIRPGISLQLPHVILGIVQSGSTTCTLSS